MTKNNTVLWLYGIIYVWSPDVTRTEHRHACEESSATERDDCNK